MKYQPSQLAFADQTNHGLKKPELPACQRLFLQNNAQFSAQYEQTIKSFDGCHGTGRNLSQNDGHLHHNYAIEMSERNLELYFITRRMTTTFSDEICTG